MGEIDPLGTRRDGLDAFLDQKVGAAPHMNRYVSRQRAMDIRGHS